jgi:hypothetical protein
MHLLHSLPFRVLVALMGGVLLAISLFVLPASLGNLPDTWLGVLESAYGVACTIAAVCYFSTNRVWLLVFMLPGIGALAFLAVNILR